MNQTAKTDIEVEQLKERITNFLSQLSQQNVQTSIFHTLSQIKDWLDLDAGYWLNLNVFSALSPTQLLNDGRSVSLKGQKLYQYIEWFRNLFIFSPILYTWYELSKATSAYGALLSQKPEFRGENLLFLWQSGALAQPGIKNPSPFSLVAIIDAAIIFLIIVLSFVIHFIRDRQVRNREQTLRALASELGGIAWEVNRIFMQKRRQFFETAEERTLALLNGLDKYVEKMNNQYQQVLEKTSRDANEIVDAVRHQVDALANQNVELATKQKLYLESLAFNIDQLLTRITSKQEELITQLNEAGENYQQQWEQIIAQWKQELSKLNEVSDKQVEQFIEITNLFSILRESLTRFQKATQQLIPALENIHKSLSENVSNINENQLRLTESIQSLEGSLRSIELVSLEWSKDLEKTLADLRGLDGNIDKAISVLQRVDAKDHEWTDLFRQHIARHDELLETIRSTLVYIQSVKSGDGFKGEYGQSS